jgi:hypothetical protein
MGAGRDNQVRLVDALTGIVISGRLRFLSSGVAEVKGIADGLTLANYLSIRPTTLTGFSPQWGGVWLGRVFRFEPRVSFEPSIPTVVRLRAIETFIGSFDPRQATIYRVEATLGRLSSLVHFQLIEKQEILDRSVARHYKFCEPALSLYADENVEITLVHSITIATQVSYKQLLAAEFKLGTTQTLAIKLLDSVFLLVAILTQSKVIPRSVSYIDSNRQRSRERRALSIPKKLLHPHEWLVDKDEMVPLLRRVLGTWLKALAAAEYYLVVQWFITAAHSTRTVESRFLLFSQCFEELNRRRIGQVQFDIETYRDDVIVPLQDKIDSLKAAWIRSDFRSRLGAAVRSANDWRFRDRIKQTMNLLPRFTQFVKEGNEDIRMRLELRRNTLSHGDPQGAVMLESDFDQLLKETSVVRALCVAELLLLAGIENDLVDRLVLRDEEIKFYK